MDHFICRYTFWAMLIAVTLGTVSAYADECYDVSKGQPASLSGVVRYVVFPGPPNFEDVQKGDEPEATYLLVLDHPICTRGDEFSDPTRPFDTIHLVGNKTTSPELKSNTRGRNA